MKKKYNRQLKLIIRYQKVILFIISLSCITISTTISWYLHTQQQRTIINEFQKDVSIQTLSFYHGLSSNMSSLDSFSAGFSNQTSFNYKLFNINAERILERNKSIKVLAFTAELQDSERHNIEKRQQKVYPNFQILEQGDNGKLVAAKTRPEYYPIYFTYPETKPQSVIGLDIGLSKAVLTALKSAEHTKHVNAALTSFKSSPQNKLFLGIAPLYHETTFTQKTNHNQASGFMLALFDLDKIFNNSVLSDDLTNVDLEVIDNNALKKENLLYHHSVNDTLDLDLAYNIKIPDDYNSIDWNLIATPSKSYIKARQNKIPEIIFLIGLAFSFLLTAYLKIMLKQSRIVERLVKRKTLELNLANEKLIS